MALNHFFLSGYVLKEPTLHYGNHNNKYTYITLACLNDARQTKNGTKNMKTRDPFDFVSVSCFGRLSDYAMKYIVKGQWIVVDGEIVSIKKEDQGCTRYENALKASKIYFAESADQPRDITPIQEEYLRTRVGISDFGEITSFEGRDVNDTVEIPFITNPQAQMDGADYDIMSKFMRNYQKGETISERPADTSPDQYDANSAPW